MSTSTCTDWGHQRTDKLLTNDDPPYPSSPAFAAADNRIGDEGAKALADGLRHNSRLKILNLSGELCVRGNEPADEQMKATTGGREA